MSKGPADHHDPIGIPPVDPLPSWDPAHVDYPTDALTRERDAAADAHVRAVVRQRHLTTAIWTLAALLLVAAIALELTTHPNANSSGTSVVIGLLGASVLTAVAGLVLSRLFTRRTRVNPDFFREWPSDRHSAGSAPDYFRSRTAAALTLGEPRPLQREAMREVATAEAEGMATTGEGLPTDGRPGEPPS